MINLKNRRAKLAAHRELVMMMDRIERAYKKRIGAIIRNMFISSSTKVGSGHIHETDWQVDRYLPMLRMLLQNMYRQVAHVFYKRVESEFGKKGMAENPDWYCGRSLAHIEIETKGMEDVFWSKLSPWISKQSLEKSNQIGSTEKKKIRDIISKGARREVWDEEREEYIVLPMTNSEMAADILKAGLAEEQWKSLQIARTETHTAACLSMNQATQAVGKEHGIIFKKYWSNADDERTRPGHVKAGEDYSEDSAIDMDDTYSVECNGTIDEMMHPGDSNADPSNVVNCRCVELYVTAEAEPGEEGQSTSEEGPVE